MEFLTGRRPFPTLCDVTVGVPFSHEAGRLRSQLRDPWNLIEPAWQHAHTRVGNRKHRTLNRLTVMLPDSPVLSALYILCTRSLRLSLSNP